GKFNQKPAVNRFIKNKLVTLIMPSNFYICNFPNPNISNNEETFNPCLCRFFGVCRRTGNNNPNPVTTTGAEESCSLSSFYASFRKYENHKQAVGNNQRKRRREIQ